MITTPFDLYPSRNESTERFLLAFDIPLRRYHNLLSYVHIIYLLSDSHTNSFSIHLPVDLMQKHNPCLPCVSATGVDGAKVENVSLEICQHPCKDLVNLMTEIHGLRFVTNNLLEDLEKIVSQKKI